MRWLVLAALALAAVVTGAPSSAAPSVSIPLRLTDKPCAGCRAVLPPGTTPAPLLVVLHGDWGHGPADLVGAWERHLLPRGIGVLALACPRDRGCKGSFWQWNGDPAWIAEAVDALSAIRPIDRARVSLAGWSGGASYMGLRAPELERSFAALVYHGGGIAPASSDCTGARAPVYFLVGSGNPLHAHAVALREHHEACKDDVTWNLVKGADHDGEWRALDTQGDAIAAWLATKHR